VSVLDADVVVVGLGPVGSTLAALLGRRGVRVVAVDRDPNVFVLPRAAHIDHVGLRTLQELGILDDLLPEMIPNPGLDFVTADRRLLMRVPGDQPSWSGLPASMYFHQPGVDRALRAAAAATAGVEVLLGAEMVGLDDLGDAVEVHLKGRGSLRASWVVGCDGAWSPVREAAGLQLEDLGFDERWLVVDLLLRDSHADLPRHAVHVCDPARPHTTIPMPGARYRFELQLADDEAAAEAIRAQNVARLLTGYLRPEDAEVERAAVYTFHGLVAHAWRQGRVFIAGDAAHQMPPFLGQGMCSGLRDAANLAWKLAHVVRRDGPHTLLDSYESERRPHVRAITQAVIDFGALICARDPAEVDERDRRLLADPRPPERRVPFRLPSLHHGPLVLDGGGQLFIQPPIDGGGPRLDDVIGTRFLVLGRNADALGSCSTWWRDRAGALVATVDDLAPWTAELGSWLDVRDAQFAVVRPDHYTLAVGSDLDSVTNHVAPLLVNSAAMAAAARREADLR